MNCPHCNHPVNRVTDTKDFGHSITRYRMCRMCGKSFATKETAKEIDLTELQEGGAEPKPPKPPKVQRYRPADPLDVPSDVTPEARPLLLQWWNEARWSRHASGATWTKAAFLASAERLVLMDPKDQIRLAKAGVERGWQALKPNYQELVKPTVVPSSFDFTPTDPSMREALSGPQY